MNEEKLFVEVTEIAGIESALRGMRHPYSSWIKSDSYPSEDGFVIGDADLKLAQHLIKGGDEHCKFLRQIQVWMNITMPRYIWQELDTYNFTVKNSTSTMHTLLSNKPITKDYFIFSDDDEDVMEVIIERLELNRRVYLLAKTVQDSGTMLECLLSAKRLLPEGFLQTRMFSTNYAQLRNIYKQRKSHRLKYEWGLICNEIERLPYMNYFLNA